MQRILLFLLIAISASLVYGQRLDTHHTNPDSTDYPNIYVKKVHEDSLQSTFIIWVKNSVKPHFHAHHTEYVEVLSGKGRMTINGKTFIVRRHDKIVIPSGATHSVTNLQNRPLKVLSIQAPKFDGDRTRVEPKVKAKDTKSQK